MEITLKNIKFSDTVYHESNPWLATGYIDGKKAFTIRDDGNGGEPYIWAEEGCVGLVRAAAEWCEGLPDKVYPKTEYFEEFSVPMTLTGYCENLLDAWLAEREKKKLQQWINRQSKKMTLFKLPGDAEQDYRTILSPFSPKAVAHILAKYPDAAICHPTEK